MCIIWHFFHSKMLLLGWMCCEQSGTASWPQPNSVGEPQRNHYQPPSATQPTQRTTTNFIFDVNLMALQLVGIAPLSWHKLSSASSASSVELLCIPTYRQPSIQLAIQAESHTHIIINRERREAVATVPRALWPHNNGMPSNADAGDERRLSRE